MICKSFEIYKTTYQIMKLAIFDFWNIYVVVFKISAERQKTSFVVFSISSHCQYVTGLDCRKSNLGARVFFFFTEPCGFIKYRRWFDTILQKVLVLKRRHVASSICCSMVCMYRLASMVPSQCLHMQCALMYPLTLMNAFHFISVHLKSWISSGSAKLAVVLDLVYIWFFSGHGRVLTRMDGSDNKTYSLTVVFRNASEHVQWSPPQYHVCFKFCGP